MASAEVDNSEEQQHEAGMDVVIKDNNDDIQVTTPVTIDEAGSTKTTMPTEQPEGPRPDKSIPTLEPLAPANTNESAPPLADQGNAGQSLTELPRSSSAPTEATESGTESKIEAKTEQIPVEKEPQAAADAGDSSLANAGDEELDNVDLTSHQSSESLPAKLSGFLESLTANFAPDTKLMWAQIFGPRYEDGDEAGDFQEDNQSNADSARESVSSKSSLQAKLARERKLDEQIQASQRRYRERVLRKEAANNVATRRGRVKSSHRSQTQTPTISPFEQAGLSLTQIRFCTEKALDETCKCFRHLHAAALEEAEDPDQPLTQGVYITQGELDHLLRELFDPQELERSNTRTRKGTLIAPLDFAQNGGVSMNIQLQASWFIPFGQLPQLRSLVMKITKRHLNEEKLAIVNRHLQKQLTLLPLSARIQNLVLQLSNYQLKEPHQGPMWPEGKQSAHELAQDLLGCIAVNEAAVLTEHQDYKNSVLVLPVEHVAKTQLSSVVSAQRLVFFRYLIDIVAAERMRLHSKTTEPPELPVQPPARRKTITGRRRSPSKRNPVELAPEKPADDEETEAAHGSLPSASEAGEVTDVPAEDDIFVSLEQIGDECEKPVSQLQQQLESAIDQLRQTLPTIDSDVALNPAIRATYLAAVACHESVLLMLENNIDVDAAMSNKLEHFIEALQGIQVQADKQTITVASPPQMQVESLRDPPRFPPPYPESTVSEEEDSKSESSTLQTQFPPPYAITSPSYWTFAPSIPEPKSSIAKLVTKSPSNKSADLRSSFLSKESPGVGAYNIQQGEKLTFQRKPSYSFGPTGGDRGNKAPNASLSKGSTGKQSSKSALRQRMKTSLEFVPPMAHSAEDNDIDFDGSTRVHFGSQYDDNHLGTRSNGDLLNDLPPDYDEGDANEDPEERTGESDETEMDRALRLQQRIFMDEFMQQVVSNQESPTHFVPRGKQHFDKTKHSKSAPYWATSEVSPGIERLLHRQRRAPTASKFRPSSASTAPVQPRTARRGVKETPAPPPPPRRQLDNDQHLAWAARISELYQSVPAPEQ